jgi:hypothetical protein
MEVGCTCKECLVQASTVEILKVAGCMRTMMFKHHCQFWKRHNDHNHGDYHGPNNPDSKDKMHRRQMMTSLALTEDQVKRNCCIIPKDEPSYMA